jgi:hypothetical protein
MQRCITTDEYVIGRAYYYDMMEEEDWIIKI